MALSNKEIGVRIRNVRRECGLTQDRFAEKFHVTQQTLSRYESGKISVPNDTLEDIAKETGISVGYFLGVDSVDFSDDELLLVEFYRRSDDRLRRKILEVVRIMTSDISRKESES